MKTLTMAPIIQANRLTVSLQRILWGPVFCLVTTIAARGQCSICKTAIANSADGASLARGLNLGILFLLAVPVLLVGSISFLIWRSHGQLRGLTASDREHQGVTGDVVG